MLLNAMELQAVQDKVEAKVNFILSSAVYNNLSEDELNNKRLKLTEKFLDAEFDKASAVPPPPPPVPQIPGMDDVAYAIAEQTDTMQKMRVNQAMQLDDLKKGLPLRTQKDFAAAIGHQLSSDDKVPVQQDLQQFWVNCERAIDGLSSAFGCVDLTTIHIGRLAPLMLGNTAWEVIKNVPFMDWSSFKSAVEKNFGLTRQQLEDAFFSMTPSNTENPDDFILRVENKRVKHKIDANTCYRAFMRTLPIEYREELDKISNYAVAMGNSQAGIYDWESLVRQARFRTQGTKLAPESAGKIMTGFGPTEKAEPLPGAAHYQSASKEYKINDLTKPAIRGKSLQPQFNSHEYQEKKCELCTELGRKVAVNHHFEDCWINPNSRYFKPSLYKARLAYLADQGKPIPKLMTKQDENTPPKKILDKTAITSDELTAFGSDLAEMLEQDGADYDECLKEAAEVNLGIQVERPDTIMMFKDGGKPDLNATTQGTDSIETVKQLLSALENFSEADFIAALEQSDAEMGDSGSSDSKEDEEEDSDYESESEKSSENNGGGTSTLTKQDVKRLLADLQKREKAGKVRSMAVNTGGVKIDGKKKQPSKPKIKSTEDYANRFKVSIPLKEALRIKPNLRGYVANMIADVAHERGLPVRIVRGTQVIEVSREQLQAEREILEQADIDDERGVVKKLERLALDKKHKRQKKTDKSAHIQEHVGKIVTMLQAMVADFSEEEEEETSKQSDRILHSKVAEITSPQYDWTTITRWVSPDTENLLELVPPSSAHYMACGEINGRLVNMVVDTGGARTMMDRTVADKLGLPIEKATKRRKFGSYYGPGGKETYYWGRIPGPVIVRIAAGVELKLNEIKVIEHSEPILIMGTDALVDSEETWKYCWVGLHPTERTGQWVFVNAHTGKVVYLPLTSWPLPIDNEGKRYRPSQQMKVEKTTIEGATPKKKVSFADEQAPKPLDIAVNRLSRAIQKTRKQQSEQYKPDSHALTQDRGQRLQ